MKLQKISYFVVLLTLLTGLSNCSKDEAAVRNYPRIETLAASSIGSTGATFSAEIISGNPSDIIEYGFCWNMYIAPRLNTDTGDSTGIKGIVTGNTFSCNVSELNNNKTYYLRAYIKTNEMLVYGTVINFTTKP